MSSLFQDIRYGLRSLPKSPGFTATAVLTLAAGIGANTSIFSVIEAVVLRPLPCRDPGRLVLLADSQDSEDGGFLYKHFESLKSENQSHQDVATYYRDNGFSRVTLASASGPLSVQGAFTSANLFPLMGVSPILVRVFTAQEEKRKDRVVVLSHCLWMSQFGPHSMLSGRRCRSMVSVFNLLVLCWQPSNFLRETSNSGHPSRPAIFGEILPSNCGSASARACVAEGMSWKAPLSDGIRCKQRLHRSATGLTWGRRCGVRLRWISGSIN